MACEALGPDLSAFADGELDGAGVARVEAHLAGCTACRDSLRVWRAAGDSLRREDATADPAPAIRRSLHDRPLRLPPTRRHRWLIPAAAAALLVAVLSFERVRASRAAGLVVEMEGRNRAETADLLDAVESLRYEAAAVLLRARATRDPEAPEVGEEMRSLAENLKRVEENLARIRAGLEREGLFSPAQESTHDPKPR
ncbi:MAG: zf-HC2 domain-containing protein [Planctomycetes bacterium]|nr:zf-HC2 domain-containing protein [Planctomycetota bacterium]